MTQTMNLTSRISGAAMLMLAALPMAALATASHAATVKVGDLNLATDAGRAAFHQRAEAAGRKYCITERTQHAYAVCRVGVRQELSEKADAVAQRQLAAQAQTFAAR